MALNNLESHPTVRNFRLDLKKDLKQPPTVMDAAWLRQLCLDAGADDVGFLDVNRAELNDQRSYILRAMPSTKALISLVFAMNREPIRSPERSIANLEFHSNYEHANIVARKIVAKLQELGVRALNPSSAFPMEMDNFPGRIWVIGHKPVAEAAGLGKIGLHRNVIHPKYGSFINLDTILISAEISEETKPIDYNPCLTCKLCVAACPVGAIEPNGRFNFGACATHNYREFMNGFTDFLENIADSKDGDDFRSRVTDSELASMWQSLSFKPNYKAAYCISVCPAGEDVIGDFLNDRAGFLKDYLKPLQDKKEIIYVVANSDAIEHVRKFPNKIAKVVKSGSRINHIRKFVGMMPLIFQSRKAVGVNQSYGLTFTGPDSLRATVRIAEGRIAVKATPSEICDFEITADGAVWVDHVDCKKPFAEALRAGSIRVSKHAMGLSVDDAESELLKFFSYFCRMVK